MKKPQKSFRDLPPIRVRREPPTVPEAVAAAQDLSDEVEQQVEIAAGLMGLPPDEVRPHVLEAAARTRMTRGAERFREGRTERIVSSAGPSRAPRAVVVERRTRPIVVERRGRPLDPRR